MKDRDAYYRYQGSNVWHFEKECQFHPTEDMIASDYGDIIKTKERPSYGTLCDHCQLIEKKRK